MPVILGVDPGERHVGMAVCDAMGMIASLYRSVSVRNPEEMFQSIVEAMRDSGAERVILGLPRNMNGRMGAKAKESTALADRLREAGLTVELWDERLTTAQAERHLLGADMSHRQRKQRIDAVAAQIMLQSYLDSRPRV